MKKVIDRNKIIEAQLNATEKFVYKAEDERTTVISPQRFIPQLDTELSSCSLNGTWNVSNYPFAEAEEKMVSADSSSWDEIEQPGIVFYDDPETVPTSIENWDRVTLAHIDENDGAILQRTLDIPADWNGKKILVHFDAVFPAARFYCNGEFLGEHLSGLTPFEKDITALVNPGESAKFAVRLIRKHKYVQLDMPRHALEFCGINQDCKIFAVDKIHINDYHLISSLSKNQKIGNILGEVSIANDTDAEKECEIIVSVADAQGEMCGEFSEKLELPAGEGIAIPVELPIVNPKPWNDEFPNLYDVSISLISGSATQTTSFKTGFRRFELINERPTMNGNPVKFRGVNHLTFHPEFGMYTPKEWLRQNLTLMKKANVNAIRTHFLGPKALQELCDELGIYLLQELPVDWGHTYLHDVDFVGPAMLRLEAGVRRDRHYPSLIVWSIGNENMPRNMEEYDDFMNHLQLFDDFVKTIDPTRSTMFPPPGPANKIKGIFETRLGDIADTHYSFHLVKEFNETGNCTSPKTWEADMDNFSRKEAVENGWSGVWFSSEYGICDLKPDLLNAPYVSIIADNFEEPDSGKSTMQVYIDRMKNEWDYMRKDPTCLGGAYFPWLCAGSGNNPWGWIRFGEDADWGIVTADLTPKPYFWAMRNLFSPVRFPDCLAWKKGQECVEFSIQNMYNAIDLNECTFRVMLNKGGKYMTMMREWQDVKVDCLPGETVKVSIPILKNDVKDGLDNDNLALMRIFLIDPKGFRPTTADILIMPENIKHEDGVLPVGPDAIM